MSDEYTEQVDALVPIFDKMNKITSQIQAEIALALMQDPKIRKNLSKVSNLSEEKMLNHINDALKEFISKMPLAQLNNSNMFLTVMGCHSDITGNPLFNDVIERIQELNFERQFENNDN